MTTQKQSLQSQIDQITKQLANSGEEKRDLHKHLSEMEGNLQSLNDTLTYTREKEQELRTEIKSSVQQKEATENKLDDVVLEKRALEKKVREMSADLDEIRRRYEQLSHHTVNQSEALCRVVELERQVMEFNQVKRALESNIATVTELLEAEQDRSRSLEARIYNSRKLEKRRKESLHRPHDPNDLNTNRANLDDIAKKIELRDHQIENLSKRLSIGSQILEDREALATKLDIIANLGTQKEVEIEKLRNEGDDFMHIAEEKQAIEQDLFKIQIQIEEKDKQLEEMKKIKSEANKLQQERESLDDELHFGKQTVAEIEQQIISAREKDAEFSRLLHAKLELESQLFAVRSIDEAKAGEIAQLRRAKEDLERTVQNLQKSIQVLQEESTNNDLKELVTEKQDLERRLDDALNNEDAVRREKVDLAKQLVDSRLQTEDAQAEIEKYRDRARNSEEQLAQLQEELQHRPDTSEALPTVDLSVIEKLKEELERKFELESKQLEQVRIELEAEQEKTRTLELQLEHRGPIQPLQLTDDMKNDEVISILQGEKSEIETQLVGLMSHLEQKEREETKLKRQIEDLQQQIPKQNVYEELASKERENKELLEMIKGANKRISELGKACAELEKTKEELAEARAESEKLKKHHEIQVENKNAEIKQLESKVRAQENEISSLDQTLTTVSQELEIAKDDSQAQQEIDKLRANEIELTAKVQRLESEIREYEQDKVLLVESAEISTAQSTYLKQQLEQREIELSEVRALQEDIEKKLRAEVTQVKADKERLKQEVRGLEVDLAGVEKLNLKLSRDITQAKELLSQRTESHEKEIAEVSKKITAEYAERIEKYEDETAEKNKLIDSANVRMQRLETQTDQAERNARALERDTAAKKRKILDLEKEKMVQEEQYDARMKLKKENIVELKEKVERLQKEMSTLKTKNEDIQDEFDELNKEIRKKTLICSTLEKDVKEKDKHVKEVSKLLNFKLARSKEEYEKRIQELEARLAAPSANEVDAQQPENDAGEVHNEETNPKLLLYIQKLLQVVDKTRRERDHFKSLCDTLDTSCNVLKKHISQKDDVISMLESQISTTQEQQYNAADKMETELHSLSNYLNRSKMSFIERILSPRGSPAREEDEKQDDTKENNIQ
jgi:chromosome segregation ATPase